MKRILTAGMIISGLVFLPAASEAHCLGYKHFRSGVVGVVDGTTTFAKRVVDRTTRFGDRVLGWFHC
ncbi:MAG: hypothetical protein JSR99_02640 [Proteobacteria bacterium]|nr:hypothetical protein [Pseudomonadota bacterium]